MAKATTKLNAQDRVILFCAATGIDHAAVGILARAMQSMAIRGFIVHDRESGAYALTDSERATLAVIPKNAGLAPKWSAHALSQTQAVRRLRLSVRFDEYVTTNFAQRLLNPIFRVVRGRLIEVRWRFVRFNRNADEKSFGCFAASEQSG
jgi:hypothetical protein